MCHTSSAGAPHTVGGNAESQPRGCSKVDQLCYSARYEWDCSQIVGLKLTRVPRPTLIPRSGCSRPAADASQEVVDLRF